MPDNPIMRYFTYQHLTDDDAREASMQLCEAAHVLEEMLPDNPEKSAGLRKLLEAKDCFVRAALWSRQ